MKKIEVYAGERTLLRDYLETSPVALIRFKAQTVLMKTEELPITSIARVVSRSEWAVKQWLADWNKRRMASIFSGHQGNANAAKLTKEQKKEIKETLEKPPSENGIPKEFWDVPALKCYVSTTFGIAYESDRSYHFLLKFSNLSFKYLDAFDRRRDDAAIMKRMAEIHKEIRPFLEDDSWEVFASDEVRVQLEALARRAWLTRGQPTVMKVDRKREAQNYIGFLDQKSFACSLFEVAWQNQEEIIAACAQFLKRHLKKRYASSGTMSHFTKVRSFEKLSAREGFSNECI